MLTYTGRKFYPANPDAEMIDVVDIAHALAMQARFAGQLTTFYSVAEHSVMVSQILEFMGLPHLSLYGLFHDAHEAYMSDIPSPVKVALKPAVTEIEKKIDSAIWGHLQVPAPTAAQKGAIKMADNVAFYIEDRDLRGKKIESPDSRIVQIAEEFTSTAIPVGIRDAKIRFLERYFEVSKRFFDS